MRLNPEHLCRHLVILLRGFVVDIITESEVEHTLISCIFDQPFALIDSRLVSSFCNMIIARFQELKATFMTSDASSSQRLLFARGPLHLLISDRALKSFPFESLPCVRSTAMKHCFPVPISRIDSLSQFSSRMHKDGMHVSLQIIRNRKCIAR